MKSARSLWPGRRGWAPVRARGRRPAAGRAVGLEGVARQAALELEVGEKVEQEVLERGRGAAMAIGGTLRPGGGGPSRCNVRVSIRRPRPWTAVDATSAICWCRRPGARRGARGSAAAACRRTTSRRSRASCCSCWRGRPEARASSRSARSAATARSGSPARCRPAAGSSRSRSTRSTPRSRAPTSRAPASPTSSSCASAARSTRCRGSRERGPFDLIFIDADKPQQRRLLRLGAASSSRRGTLIIVDNVVRDGARGRRRPATTRACQGVRRVHRAARRRAARERDGDPDRRRQGLRRLRHRARRIGLRHETHNVSWPRRRQRGRLPPTEAGTTGVPPAPP